MDEKRQFRVKIFSDGADKKEIMDMYRQPYIKGFTTNPTLMRKAGITHYEDFARDIIQSVPDRSISFEVFSDEFEEMHYQALKIASWGENVYVKIPITNTRADSSIALIRSLAAANVKLNVTALMTLSQVELVTDALKQSASSYISVFAGRIADTGCDPLPIMKQALHIMSAYPQLELIWGSPRELLNIIQADEMGCHIITVTHDILKKLSLLGKDLTQYSLDTVKMFYHDAVNAGFTL